jgi:5'-phosphate synthase pdxT subunit
MEASTARVGVLCLQGSFAEHLAVLKRMGVWTVEVRLPEDLSTCDGLILPGGESTAMALIGETSGIFPALRTFVQR